jgi:Zn-dependent membrane protease YugP
VSFASSIVQWVLLAGVLFIQTMPMLLWLGIGLFAVTTLFSFITLPVEINASARAVSWLSQAGITDGHTRPMAIDALKWAAYTYVIAAVGSLATLLYYIGLARGRD